MKETTKAAPKSASKGSSATRSKKQTAVTNVDQAAAAEKKEADKKSKAKGKGKPIVSNARLEIVEEPKAAAKPKAKKEPAADTKPEGLCATIRRLASEGKTTAEIVEMGYNKATVYRQVGEWKREQKKGKK